MLGVLKAVLGLDRIAPDGRFATERQITLVVAACIIR
jgi:hypothetical protein